MRPIKTVVSVYGRPEWGLRKLSACSDEIDAEGPPSHWRARKRDIIFMLSPRVSMALLPALVRAREMGKERVRDAIGGPLCASASISVAPRG